MPYIDFEGSRIHYEVLGRGEPLVFIHEWNTSSSLFKKVNLRDFQEHFQVILVDLPGFGRSESLKELSLENLSGVICAVMRQNQLERAVVMGACLGAIVALDFAIRRQALVKKLVLLEIIMEFPAMLSVLFWPVIGAGLYQLLSRTRSGLSLFARLWRPNSNGQHSFYKKMLFKSFKKTNRTSAYCYLKMLHEYRRVDFYSQIGNLRAQTLCLCGEDTPEFIQQSARKVYRNLREGELAFIRGCRHFLLLEKPQETYSLIKGFAARC